MDKLKAILSIKLALAFRISSKNQLETVMRIFVGIMIAGLLIAGSGWLGVAYRNAEINSAGHFFPALCWIIALIWISAMMSPYSLQDNLHFEGLALLPVTKGQFVGALIINALVSYMGAFVPVIIVLTITAFGITATLAIWAAAVTIVFWSGLLISGQLILLVFGRILTSRRFMDIAVIIGTVIAFLFYFIRFFFISESFSAGGFQAFFTKFNVIAEIAKYLPPGLAGWSFNSMAAGDTFVASATFGLLVLEMLALLFAAGYVVERFFIGELSVGGAVKQAVSYRSAKAGVVAAPGLGLVAYFSQIFGFGEASSGLYVKEWRYLFREPVYKLRLINSLMMFAYFLVFFLVFGKDIGLGATMSAGTYVLPILTYLTVIGDLRIAANKFGMDGESITCLLISPVRRDEILFAKSLFGLTILQSLNAVIILGGGLLLKVDPLLILLCVLAVFPGALIVEAWGNILSVYFPYKIVTTSGRRGQPRFESGGCMFQLVYLIATIATNMVAVPVMAAVVVPHFFGAPVIGVFLFPVAAIIGFSLFKTSLSFSAQKLKERELAIIELMEADKQ